MSDTPLHADFVTEFGEENILSNIKHHGDPNRPIATAAERGLKSFSAETKIVQWGRYDGDPAILLVMWLSFQYRPQSVGRIVEANIKIMLEEEEQPEESDKDNDPVVHRIGPVRWELDGHKEGKEPVKWTINPQVSIGSATASVVSLQSEWKRRDVEYSMKLNGVKTTNVGYGDFHGATWQIYEDGYKGDGILTNFPVMVVATAPKNPARTFVARVTVRAKIANILSRDLVSKNDAPVYFDLKTSKPLKRPRSYGSEHQDFTDEAFPWDDIGLIPSTAKIVAMSPA